MNFLVGLGTKIFELLLGDLVAWATQKYADYKARKAIEDAAKKSVQKLKDAKTGGEVDSAADDSLNGV